MNKLTINGNWYVNLDSALDIDSCPNVDDAIVSNYEMIRHSCGIRTFDLDDNDVPDTSGLLVPFPIQENLLKTNKDIFITEFLHKVRSPYYVLNLRQGGHESYVYDAIKTPKEVWDSITWKDELTKRWNPFKEWVENLPVKRIGHIGLFINRPGVIPWYHVDSGQDDDIENWKPTPHRGEFIWINLDKNKTFYVLDNNKIPVQIKSRSAFFNTNNWHGGHEATHSWSCSVRIDCIFSDEFRQQLGIQNIEGYYYEKSSQ